MPDVILIENLCMTVANKTILRDINLLIDRNCPLTIIGESGAGKTTLARALVGNITGKVQGKIKFNGRDVLKQSPKSMRDYRRHETGIVLQNMGESLNPQLSVMTHLLECVGSNNLPKKYHDVEQRAHEMLMAFHVPESLWHRRPKGLSGGEIQRVLLAMAMMNDPQLLILDEPSSALDQSLTDLLTEYLATLKQQRYLVLISHDLALAKQVKGAVAVMREGKIVEWGEARQIFSAPAHPYTQALVHASMHTESMQSTAKCAGNTLDDADGVGRNLYPYLSLCDLSKSFSHHTVLRSIHLTLHRGEWVALLGASGQGKSTLAAMISGALIPDSGKIIKHVSPLRVTWVSQHPSRALAPHFSLFDAVAEPLVLQKYPRKGIHKKVVSVLQKVHMPTDSVQLNQRIHCFSGGELQRIDLARALITQPHIIIADEITASLDVQIRNDIMKILLDLKVNAGLTVLLITHDRALADATVDRCYWLRDGELS